MKFKKRKRHHRCVRFFKTCFGFREPFKVLCDGTFIHHLVANQITPHEKAIKKTLGGLVQLFTTRCVVGELSSLGASHAESLKEANHNFKIASCDHEKRINAAACIAEIVGENNCNHFFIATQDADLRKKLQEIPGVPVMFGLRNALFLEQPSSFQREFINTAEEDRLHVSEKELNLLQKRTKEMFNGLSGDEHASDEIVAMKKKISKDRLDVKDKVQFKKKRAKGPNPLSCKKKKDRVPAGPNTQKADKGGGGDESGGRNRKRKRTRKGRSAAVGSSGDGS